MKRMIVHIDEEKCNGCGLCARACHEGAIGLVNGKAKLLREDYCDGMGDCLPSCPAGAISFEQREAAAYDAAAVQANRQAQQTSQVCPGTKVREMNAGNRPRGASQLRQWPAQIQLAPIRASYFDGADLLIAADCTAYAYAAFHTDFMRGRVTLIGCPKLDRTDYAEKLTAILKGNNVRSVLVVRMEVPCCGGLLAAVRTALQNSGKALPLQVVTIGIDGERLPE